MYTARNTLRTGRSIFHGGVIQKMTPPYTRARGTTAHKICCSSRLLKPERAVIAVLAQRASCACRASGNYVAVGAHTTRRAKLRASRSSLVATSPRGVRLGSGLLRRPLLVSANRRTYRETEGRPERCYRAQRPARVVKGKPRYEACSLPLEQVKAPVARFRHCTR